MRLAGFALIVALGVVLVWGSGDLPLRGDPDAPAPTHVATYYTENSLSDSKTPNAVTAVLADYRGFDTFGEAVVVVAAALACLLILLRRRDDEDGDAVDGSGDQTGSAEA
jgi:multicomponent Na+:H+ antiporter subunit B